MLNEDYIPKIPKEELKDGQYYQGRCRNATVARWCALDQKFYHWRTKFGHDFIEEICCPEDEKQFDVFVTECEIDTPERQIPIVLIKVV